MSLRRIVRVASLVAASLSLSASPLLAAAPAMRAAKPASLTPDVGVRVTPMGTSHDSIEVSPWVWEPDASDSLRIAVGTHDRRIVVRVWLGAAGQHGRFIEQRRANGHWQTISRTELSAADLAGGSTDPLRTRYARPGFLAFDASTLGVEGNGGLAYSVVAAAGQRLSIHFGAHDQRSGRWSDLTRTIDR